MMRWKTFMVLMVFITGACTRMASTFEAQPTPTDQLRLCTGADLQPSSSSNGATGSIVLGVTLVNISKSPCLLVGPPQVTLSMGAEPLEIEYLQADTQPASSPAPTGLRISPGESAIAILIWSNYCGAARDGPTIHLGLTTDEALDIAADAGAVPRCDVKNEPSTLTVYPYSYPP